MGRWSSGLFSLLVSLAFAAPSSAGEPRKAQSDLVDGLTLESTGHAVYIRAPKVHGLGIYAAEGFLTGDAISTEDEGRVDDVGGGWDGRLSFQLPYGPEGWSLELGGSYAEADSEEESTLSFDGADAFTPVPINGRNELGFLGLDQGIRQRFDGDVQIWDTRIGVALDLDLAEFVEAKARLGLVGGMIEQEYDISHTSVYVGPFFPTSPPEFLRAFPSVHRLNEDLDSYFVGPYLGFELEAQLTERLSVSLDTEVALLYNDAELQASQDIVGFYQQGPGDPPCAFSNFGGPGRCHVPESDRESSFGVRPRIRLGFDLDMGPFILGVHGGATYWSYAPQIINPQYEDGDVGGPGQGEAHISGDDMLVADLGVKLTIPFGRDDMTASSLPSFAAAAGAALEDWVPGLYFESAGYAVHMDVPDVEGLGLRTFDAGGPGFIGPLPDEGEVENWGGAWDGRLGFAFPGSGDDGAWSVEMGGSYAKVEDSSNAVQRPSNDEFIVSVPINGQQRITFLGYEQDVRQQFDGEVELWDVSLGVATDVSLLDGLRTRVRAGLVGGVLDQEYTVQQETTELRLTPPNLFFGFGGLQRIDEEVKNRFVGPYLGFDLEAQVTDRLSVFLDTEIALLYNESRFSATQEVAGNTLSPSGPRCDLFGGAPPFDRCGFSYDASEVDHKFGARPRVRAGFDVDLGAFTVGVVGGVTYWTYAPQIVNGEGGPTFSGPGFPVETAHVSGDDLLAGDVGVKITIPLH
jgi:hypothetical protein